MLLRRALAVWRNGKNGAWRVGDDVVDGAVGGGNGGGGCVGAEDDEVGASGFGDFDDFLPRFAVFDEEGGVGPKFCVGGEHGFEAALAGGGVVVERRSFGFAMRENVNKR